MISLTLQLRPCADPLPVTAGWIASPEVRVWLSEARRVLEADARAEVKLYPLAASAQDASAGGALLTVAGTRVPLDKVLGAQVQRLGEAAPGVLVPVHARLEPALTAEECRRLFPWALHFLHPVLGLTGFDAADALTPAQILTLPPVERARWFAAVPGPPEPPALKQITLVQEVSLEELMSGEGDDIASQRPDKQKTSPSSGGELMGRAAGMVGGTLAGLGAGILRTLGAGGAADRMSQWSQKAWSEVFDRRKRELNRLLERFEKDPLGALRHAIPLTGGEARRGAAAQPGWTLGARSMELNSRTHGSGPVDVWNIDHDTRLKLERRYRDAATREAEAGNHGRAAYIYGELLGDWNMAAQMLEKAGRTREAARIYLDRLRSGPRAAACLEKAGLLAEAASLYREAGMHEKAGDLLAALGQEEEAREQWREALKKMSNPLEQARLLETKLHDTDRALYVLDRAWPGTPQAPACFQEEFNLLGRYERHAEAAEVLARLERDPRTRIQPLTATVSGLRSVFNDYPDSEVRERAAYLAIQFSGEFLARDPNGVSAKQLLNMLPDFAPGDRLLPRDTARFSIGHNKPAVPLIVRTEKVLRPVKVVELRKEIAWKSLASNLRTLSVAGWVSVKGTTGSILFREVYGAGSQPGESGFQIKPQSIAHVLTGDNGAAVNFFRETARASWVKGETPLSTDDCLALGQGSTPDEFLLLTYKKTAGLVAETYSAGGELSRTRVLDLAPPDILQSNWFAGAHGDDIWVGGPSVACCVNDKVQFQIAQLNGEMTCFAVAPRVMNSCAIAVASNEAVLLVPRGKDKRLECVNLWAGSGDTPPLATFTHDGRAVIADGRGGVVYALRKTCEKTADIIVPPGSGDLISIASRGTTGFAFLTSTGKLLFYGEAEHS